MSGGMAVILCAVLACSAPLAITSASSLPSMTALQPGIKSPHRSTFAIARPPSSCATEPCSACRLPSPRSISVATAPTTRVSAEHSTLSTLRIPYLAYRRRKCFELRNTKAGEPRARGLISYRAAPVRQLSRFHGFGALPKGSNPVRGPYATSGTNSSITNLHARALPVGATTVGGNASSTVPETTRSRRSGEMEWLWSSGEGRSPSKVRSPDAGHARIRLARCSPWEASQRGVADALNKFHASKPAPRDWTLTDE